MRILEFKVEAQILECIGDFSNLVQGTSGYLHASFEFSEEWKSCEKIVSFFDRKGNEYAVRAINNKCLIPKEVLDYRHFRMMVTGIKSNYKIVTNKIKVIQGGD